MTILIFVIILGLLVFVHELGHFITARRNGVGAQEFGFGFPPRLIGFVKNDAGRYKIVWGNKSIESKNTVYSVNWIPLGGFVRIKGEDPTQEDAHDKDSFATKSAWVRFKILVAGVAMNFFMAWVLISIVLMIGFPQEIAPGEASKYKSTSVQILQIAKDSPADTMGLKAGDVVLKLGGTPVKSLEDVSNYINAHKGEKVSISVSRGETLYTFEGVPRVNAPAGEGALGISFSQTAIVSYPWYQAIWEGLKRTYEFTVEILRAFGSLIGSLFTGAEQKLDIAGPVGIVYLTKQMSELGFVFLLQFTAILSINLGIINVLPIPALDGGRIFFLILEKLKGKPLSRPVENRIHQIGFILLIALMIFVTFHDFLEFDVFDKLINLF